MKIEQLIVQYLYQNKEVTLQGIGTFRLNPSVELPADGTKDFTMPEDAFEFEDNQKATEDEGLLNYVIKSGKIRPLAISDIDSYITLSKQFLNIGNPMLIEGVGTLQKNRQEDYVFTSGQFVNTIANNGPKQIKERKDEEVSFQTESKSSDNRKYIMIAMASAVVILITLGVYYLFSSDQPEEPVAPPVKKVVIQAPVVDTVKKDTVVLTKPDTVIPAKPITPIAPADKITFKIVLREYPSHDAALKEYERLRAFGNKVIIYKKDTNVYAVAMSFTKPLSYAIKAKDSLSALLGCSKAYVVIP